MARKSDSDYFELLTEMAHYAYVLAQALQETFENYDVETLAQKMEEFHTIENACDGIKHKVIDKLAKDFITPIEREDILRLAGVLDDIVDGIEDLPIKMYMYNLQTVKPQAVEFAKIIVACTKELNNLLKEFANFKKSSMLNTSIIELNRLEEVGDKLYMRAVRNLYVSGGDPIEVTSWSAMYTLMEACCDNCEHTANVVEEILMKNA